MTARRWVAGGRAAVGRMKICSDAGGRQGVEGRLEWRDVETSKVEREMEECGDGAVGVQLRSGDLPGKEGSVRNRSLPATAKGCIRTVKARQESRSG